MDNRFVFGDRVQVINYEVCAERELFVSKKGTVVDVPDEYNCYYTVAVHGDTYAEEFLFEEDELDLLEKEV